MKSDKTHILTYTDSKGKKHRLRVRIASKYNSKSGTMYNVIQGRPGAEWFIVGVKSDDLRPI